MRRTTVKRALRPAVVAVLAAVSAPIALGSSSGPAAPPPNLIRNGGAESGPAVSNDTAVVASIPGWTRTGGFTAVKYGSPGGFPDASTATAIHGGLNFFAGGPANPNSGATQDILVRFLAARVGAPAPTATLSGDLGGYGSQNDSLTVVATFRDASGRSVGKLSIGPVSAAKRQNRTGLVARTATGKIPRKTKLVHVAVKAVRTDGSYNDCYADNLSLTIVQ